MSKNAVYRDLDFNLGLYEDINLKRAALLFDKIYVSIPFIPDNQILEKEKIKLPDSYWDRINEGKALYEYLLEENVIGHVKTQVMKMEDMAKEQKKLIDTAGASLMELSNSGERTRKARTIEDLDKLSDERTKLSKEIDDCLIRFSAISWSKTLGQECYPLLHTKSSYEKPGKKQQVVEIVLESLPMPGIDTPWEQIIDFRRDEYTRLKYLALINWINEISYSPLTKNEIEEKFEYLYYDYKRSFEIHKMKTSLAPLEILIACGTALFTGNLSASMHIASSLIKIGSATLNLRSDEGNLPGKEIAYIYQCRETFQ
jgi:hypothetical protein